MLELTPAARLGKLPPYLFAALRKKRGLMIFYAYLS